MYAPVLGITLFIVFLATQLTWLGRVAVVAVVLGVCSGAILGNWLFNMWPAGIRLDGDGVRIGGVRWSERHPGEVRTGTAIAPRQYSQVFACPWDGVLRIGVATDRQALRRLARRSGYRQGLKGTALGNLAAPFMRAGLVVWVDTDRAQFPQVRAPRSPLWVNAPGAGYRQPIWAVPTRHPAGLRTALAALPQSAGRTADAAAIIRAAVG